MTKKDYNILKEEETLANKIWDHDQLYGSIMKANGVYRVFKCDFELLGFKKKETKSLCENFLRKTGFVRTQDIECCEFCPHCKCVNVSDSEMGLILNICTTSLDYYTYDE